MIKQSFNQLLKKYQAGRLDKQGSKLIDDWYQSLDDIAVDDPLQQNAKAASIRSSIHTNLLQHIQDNVKKRFIHPWYYIAAACFALVFSAVFLIQKPNRVKTTDTATIFITIKTPAGVLKKIVLPDSSEVWLNAGSVLRYSQQSFKTERNIYLDEGEAFFTVVKNPKYPFFVHSTALNTKVLGTQFNVKSYHLLNYASVEVKNGRVMVTAGPFKKADTLIAAQSLVYNKTTQQIVKNNNLPGVAGSWIDGTTVLHEATFNELALIMNNRYQVTLKAGNPAIKTYHYTINILQQTSLNEALSFICTVHQNKYRRKNNEIIIY